MQKIPRFIKYNSPRKGTSHREKPACQLGMLGLSLVPQLCVPTNIRHTELLLPSKKQH
ncbi:MAG: hypothetical protein RL571_1782 [Pseudomonadota bacterium]|jgi:hypothetical protein